MGYARYGIWGFIFFIAIVASRSYMYYERHRENDQRQEASELDRSEQRQNFLDEMQHQVRATDRQLDERHRMNEQFRAQQEEHQKRLREQAERNRQHLTEQRERIEEALKAQNIPLPSE